jgi:nicotinate-nucleotide pyrophosphorylase (carboxylating)
MSTIPELDIIIERALAEDIGDGDVTTVNTISASATTRGEFVAKSSGIVAGLEVAARVFTLVDAQTVFTPACKDGDFVTPKTVIATITGPARALLIAERTALNFIQRMSGIATATRRYVDAIQSTSAVILDTRKTVPGLRLLDKWAVRLGGGQNHRIGLYDMVLIKDNHIAAVGSITEAVQRVRAGDDRHRPIEVEVKNLDELREALALTPDRILLDNMSVDEMREAVNMTGGRVLLEASGGVTLESVAAIANTGVNFISVGALTHSVTALDISLELDPLSSP